VTSAARSGQSQVLVLRGEAGIGKTALLDFVSERASGFRTTRVSGVESEMELAFAALQQVCVPLLDCIDRFRRPNARHWTSPSAAAPGRRPIVSWSVWRC
jgi:chromosomal replication initiation ATPase DnaA